MFMFVVYAIKSRETGRIYVGQAQDVKKRLELHNGGRVKSTSKDGSWCLVAIENFETRDLARWCEKQLKSSRGRRVKWLDQQKI
jgi:putative endonuclease